MATEAPRLLTKEKPSQPVATAAVSASEGRHMAQENPKWIPTSAAAPLELRGEEEHHVAIQSLSLEDDELDAFILEALRTPKERKLLLNLEKDFERLILNPKLTRLDFPPMNALHRRIVHRAAAYFRLDHVLNAEKQAVVVYKNSRGRIPALRFSDLVEGNDEKMTKPVKIMKKESPHPTTPINQRVADPSTPESGPTIETKTMSIEEREEQYLKARARIFGDTTTTTTTTTTTPPPGEPNETHSPSPAADAEGPPHNPPKSRVPAPTTPPVPSVRPPISVQNSNYNPTPGAPRPLTPPQSRNTVPSNHQSSIWSPDPSTFPPLGRMPPSLSPATQNTRPPLPYPGEVSGRPLNQRSPVPGSAWGQAGYQSANPVYQGPPNFYQHPSAPFPQHPYPQQGGYSHPSPYSQQPHSPLPKPPQPLYYSQPPFTQMSPQGWQPADVDRRRPAEGILYNPNLSSPSHPTPYRPQRPYYSPMYEGQPALEPQEPSRPLIHPLPESVPAPVLPSHILEVTGLADGLSPDEIAEILKPLTDLGATVKTVGKEGNLSWLVVFKTSTAANRALTNIESPAFALHTWVPNVSKPDY